MLSGNQPLSISNGISKSDEVLLTNGIIPVLWSIFVDRL
ncbi:MAG: hypothetical protein ANABAC_2795 [Anaerolineae bacterium]|nr:MAG: hypothetical protein ANABAC_2795 [Anaerolineae bacterium]